MIDEKFYIELWHGNKADMIKPKQWEMWGYVHDIANPDAFFFRYGTLDGIKQQYKELNMTVGLIYHMVPMTNGMDKRCCEKTREEIRADGHYNNLGVKHNG